MRIASNGRNLCNGSPRKKHEIIFKKRERENNNFFVLLSAHNFHTDGEILFFRDFRLIHAAISFIRTLYNVYTHSRSPRRTSAFRDSTEKVFTYSIAIRENQ